MAYFSVLGDSISTFEGCNPEGYAVFYEPYNAFQNGIKSVRDTWWYQVISSFGGALCVNNSYSGSRVSGENFPAASSAERTSALHKGDKRPDVILIYIGFNDFGYGVMNKKKGIWNFGKDSSYFFDAYCIMLERIKKNYPQAEIICGTLMKSGIKGMEDWNFPEHLNGHTPFSQYNQSIRTACGIYQVRTADLAQWGRRYETLDGAHPTADGHRTIGQCWIDEIQRGGGLSFT